MKSLLNILERRTLQTKLLLGFTALMLFMLVMSIGNLFTYGVLRADLHTLYEKELLGVSNAKDAQLNYLAIGRELRQASLAGAGKAREAALKSVTESDAALQLELQALRPRLFRPEAQAVLALFEREYAAYKLNVQKARSLLEKGAEAEAAAYITSDEFRRPGVAANEAITKLTTIKEADARVMTEEAIAASDEAFWNTSAALGAATALSLLIGWGIARSIRRPTDALGQAVVSLAAGKLQTEIPFLDYENEIGSLARSVQVLQRTAQDMDDASWLKTHLAQCAQALQTSTSFTALTQTLFSHLAPLIKLGQGVFYVYEEEQRRLRMLSSYAFRERKSLDQYFNIGQGLVGQCAMERAPIILQSPPADYIRIGSSLGEAAPRSICVIPILRNDRLLGVLELASFQGFTVREQALVDGLIPLLATNLEILERSVKTSKLLDETRTQARLMQQQAAQLEEQTEELEAQQAALKDTEAWYRSIIESAPDGMLVVNARGAIVLTNPKLEALFGYAPGELDGQMLEVLIPSSARSHHGQLREGYMQEGSTRAMNGLNRELKGVRKDGSEFEVEVGLSQLAASASRGVNVCASVRDIAERKHLEQAVLAERARLQAILDKKPNLHLHHGNGRESAFCQPRGQTTLRPGNRAGCPGCLRRPRAACRAFAAS